MSRTGLFEGVDPEKMYRDHAEADGHLRSVSGEDCHGRGGRKELRVTLGVDHRCVAARAAYRCVVVARGDCCWLPRVGFARPGAFPWAEVAGTKGSPRKKRAAEGVVPR